MPTYPDHQCGFNHLLCSQLSGAVLPLNLTSLSDDFMALLVLHARRAWCSRAGTLRLTATSRLPDGAWILSGTLGNVTLLF